jgi:hypothetical protein
MWANFTQLWDRSTTFRTSIVLCVVGVVVLFLNSGGGGSQPSPAPAPAPANNSSPGLTNPLTGSPNAPANPLMPPATPGLPIPAVRPQKAVNQAVQIGEQVLDGVSNQVLPPARRSRP